MNTTKNCRYCHNRIAIMDGLCRICWEMLTELLLSNNTSAGINDSERRIYNGTH